MFDKYLKNLKHAKLALIVLCAIALISVIGTIIQNFGIIVILTVVGAGSIFLAQKAGWVDVNKKNE